MRYLTCFLGLLLTACAATNEPQDKPSPQPIRPQPAPEPSPAPEFPNGIEWRTDWYAAGKEAAKESKLLFVEFSGEFCAPCRKLEKTVWPDSKLAARIEREFVPIQVMDESGKDIAKLYDIEMIPSIVIAKSDGEMLLKQVGPPFSRPDQAIVWVDGIAPRLKNAEQAEAAAKAKPDDFATQLELFRISNDLGRAKQAEEAMMAAEKLAGDNEGNRLEINIGRMTVLTGKRQYREAMALADQVWPVLVKNKDKRMVELGLGVCDLQSFLDKKDELRALCKQVNELFPKNANFIQYQVRAAFALYQAGDKANALTELNAIVEAGPADDIWVNYASEVREELKRRADSPKEGG